MKAAVVKQNGATPVFADFADPLAEEGVAHVTVSASALSHVTRSRASGTHYSSSGQSDFVPGIDGTGVLNDGTRVYFVMPETPYGGMAERCIVKPSRCIPLPPGLDDTTAAAIAIPGMSSWAALTERAKMAKGETVLINGATGASGRLAVQIAKYLGASKVIATGRDAAALETLRALGADVTINIGQDDESLEHALEATFRDGVGIILDYLWGPSAEALLNTGTRAAPDAVPIRFIQIGAISAHTITLPSAALRSSPIELMGSGIGSIPMPRILNAIRHVLEAAVPAGFEIATRRVPLADVALHWTNHDSRTRTVFTVRD
jgi:NADPH:quinone reductase-like Zn-dependent oxidoreductase